MANKNRLYLISTGFFVVLSIGMIGYALISKQQTSTGGLAAQSKSTQTVDVSVTPTLSDSGYEFYMELNTHTTELSYNLAASSILANEKGQTLQPVKWDGDPEGGHHRKGKLFFAKFSKTPETLILTISNIDQQALEFKWDL